MNWKCVMASVALVGTMLSGNAASIELNILSKPTCL